MNITEKKFEFDGNHGVQMSAEPQMQAIAAQFSSRGLVKSVEKDTEAQILRENQTRAEEPEAYRLSELSEGYITARYRHGKDTMSGNDLLEYFCETRARRTQNADFSESAPSDEEIVRGEAEKTCVLSVKSDNAPEIAERIAALPQKIRTLPEETVEKIKLSTPIWFDKSRPDTKSERRRFPLSAFAAILAIAMSLTLVVASSVLVNHAEGRLNTLKIEVSQVSSEVSDMKSDLSVQHDLLALREIAVNEMGMVDEDFVRTEYVSNHSEDSIVILEEEEEKNVGLSAILNALGIK